MKKIFIVGAGTMGAGIAQVFAAAGFDTVINDMTGEILEKAVSGLTAGLGKLVSRGKMTEEDKAGILSRIKTTCDITEAAGCDLVLEAIAEKMEVKKALFSKLDGICGPKVIFATNTSSLSITEIAGAASRPDKFIGMHFFNPAAVMKLVEIIRGIATSDETFAAVSVLAREIGKEAVEVKEAPGFVVNKILIPMINEAVFLLEQGVASAEDIDKAMTLGANHPIGPLALADLIGNDIVLSIMDVLLSETGDTKYRAAALLRKMVRGGLLGRKSGRGFFNY